MKNRNRIVAILLALLLAVTLWGSIHAFGADENAAARNGNGSVTEEDTDVDVPFEPDKTVRSLSIQSQPNQLVYLKGQELNLTGLVVKAIYIDNTNTIVTNYQHSGYDPNTLGEQTVTLSFSGKTASFKVSVYDIGDVNGDLHVNEQDANLLLQYTAGWDVTIQTVTADVNGDGVINGNDATLLLQYAAGWDVTLG